MLQTRTTRWAALTACACIVVLVAAWLLLVSPRRADAADLHDQATAARTQNGSLEVKIAQLRAQFATLSQDKAELAEVYVQMPQRDRTAELVRSLDTMANQSGVVLKSITPGAGSYLAPAAGGPPSATGSSGAGAAGAATGATGAVRVVGIPVVIAVHGDYFQAVLFLKKLQTDLPRAFLVTGLQVNASAGAAGSGVGAVDLTVTGKVFALPDPATAPAGGSAGGSAGRSGSVDPGTPGSSQSGANPAAAVTTTSFTVADPGAPPVGVAAGEVIGSRAGAAPHRVSSRAGAAPHRVSEDS